MQFEIKINLLFMALLDFCVVKCIIKEQSLKDYLAITKILSTT